jgi:hypothetical protein
VPIEILDYFYYVAAGATLVLLVWLAIDWKGDE